MSSTLAWILAAGLTMSLLALSGSITLLLPALFDRVVLPLVAVAAGSLLGGALFHMLPSSVAERGNDSAVYGLLAAGVFGFFLLEKYLRWHHCHRPVSEHRPVGVLILVADAVHNFVDGLAIGSAFVLDTRGASLKDRLIYTAGVLAGMLLMLVLATASWD